MTNSKNLEETNVIHQENVDQVEKEVADKEISTDLILGKFKNIEDLKTAYQNLQKQQGEQSEELGQLRKLKQGLQMVVDKNREDSLKEDERAEYINSYLSKYDNENYFQNEAFKQLYSSAFKALGTDLDTDGFVEQLENYVASRLLMQEQLKYAQEENKSATDSLNFSRGEQSSDKKNIRLQDIPADELRKYIAKYV